MNDAIYMIPPIIHYCWFGKQPIPPRLASCMDTWKELMPKWEIKRWDESNFDINSSSWTQGAYAAGKYAFVSDYVRLKALYEEGGIYLDTDVKLIKSLASVANRNDAFMGFETVDKLTSAVIGVIPKHPLIKKFLRSYQDKHFSHEIVEKNEANVLMMTDICKSFGLVANNEEQEITILSDGKEYRMHVFSQEYFCPLDFYHNMNQTANTLAIHYFDASWLDEETKRRIHKERSSTYKLFLTIKSKLARLV